MKFLILLVITFSLNILLVAQNKIIEKNIFPFQEKHVHSSSIVELPNGDLLSCWFQGSGERWANDVVINGARLKKGEMNWSKPFLMADTPNHPDCNPMLFLNPENELFLFWIVVQANKWETSILKFKSTKKYSGNVAPEWEWQDIILFTPDDNFAKTIEDQFNSNEGSEMVYAEYAPKYETMIIEAAKDNKKRTIGWMTRTHPTILNNGRILMPIYSDGFNLAMIAISDDNCKTWTNSLPIVGRGNSQPSIVQKNDGSLVAFMRNDGDYPGSIMQSFSNDNGVSWSYSQKTEIPNPGSSLEALKLKSGNWLLIFNDTVEGRHQLAAALSDDEGKTWYWKRYIEKSEKGKGSFAYPSVIQTNDEKIHLTYSYHLSEMQRTIKHVSFDENWVKE
ncbi:MAG: exo-alpha-sialidase [Ignavibacteriae bacterium]|nr:exo-alpha-sialidase [Ignavibacteriota bacterium]